MRRPVLFILAGVIVLLLGTAGILLQMYRRAVATNRKMGEHWNTQQVNYDRAFGAIAEIQDSLSAIAEWSTLMGLRAEGPEPLGRTVDERKRKALDRIAAIDARIQDNKAKIMLLETDLRKGGVRATGLENTVTALKQSVARAEDNVAQLKGRVKAMTTKVTSLESQVHRRDETIQARETTIEEKRRELATVYYVIGTKKDLTKNHVVVGKGGVLGLGRSLQVSRHLSETLFTPWDTDRASVIRIPARKAVVLSAQLAGSYSLEPDGDQITLAIIDPSEFRKVKHLVIMTR